MGLAFESPIIFMCVVVSMFLLVVFSYILFSSPAHLARSEFFLLPLGIWSRSGFCLCFPTFKNFVTVFLFSFVVLHVSVFLPGVVLSGFVVVSYFPFFVLWPFGCFL